MSERCSLRLRDSVRIYHHYRLAVWSTDRQIPSHECVQIPCQSDAWSRRWHTRQRRLAASHTSCMYMCVCRGDVCRVQTVLIHSVCCSTNLRKLEVRVLAYLEENANEKLTSIDF